MTSPSESPANMPQDANSASGADPSSQNGTGETGSAKGPGEHVAAPPMTDSAAKQAAAAPEEKASFAETVLRLGGKSDEEARRTGAFDKADEQVEALFQPQYQTQNSPAHRVVWENTLPLDLFDLPAAPVPQPAANVMQQSLTLVKRLRDTGKLLDENNKISESVLKELAGIGYWGLLVDKTHGGSQAPFAAFAPFLTQMAIQDATIAGLASVHGCIGAVDPVRTFGNAEQKARYLPKLASGERLSAFALTEPCAGSDLTALRTKAELHGSVFKVTGEKLFITNVVPGRTIGLVCLVEGKPSVLIVDLPQQETAEFQFKRYGLYALKHTYNQGMVFNGLEVPKENLLEPGKGDGLTIAYHGLNLGRIALCANAAGGMRVMLASMLPWARFRKTYAAPIAKRELVRRRLARMAGLIVACDALVAWCSRLIDLGYRGEMECVIAKIFGSEALKEAAVELCMKTHGGRSFLHGHMFGDNVHEFLAPCIYEGEGEMLGMAFFKSLVKQHGREFFEPIGKVVHAKGIRRPNPLNPMHAWALKKPLWEYGKWTVGEWLTRTSTPDWPQMPKPLLAHAEFAWHFLRKMPMEISGVMRKHQLALADRQCRISEVSLRVQKAIVILVTALYASKQHDEVARQAADLLCRDLTRELLGLRPSDRSFRDSTRLGELLAEQPVQLLRDVPVDDILMSYDD